MPYDPQRLGRNVKAARKGAGLLRAELGENAGLDRHRIADIETGRVVPTVETLCKIAKAAGVTLADLVEGVDT